MERQRKMHPNGQSLVVWGLIGGLTAGQIAFTALPPEVAVPLAAALVVQPEAVAADGLGWNLLAYVVVHSGWAHLALTGVALAQLGRPVARHLDAQTAIGFGTLFWVLLAVAAVGGAAAHVVSGTKAPLMGALPLVFGLAGAGPVLVGGGVGRALRHRALAVRLGLGAALAVLLLALPSVPALPVAGAGAIGGFVAGLVAAAIIVRVRRT